VLKKTLGKEIKSFFLKEKEKKKNEKRTLPSAQIYNTRQRNKIIFLGKKEKKKNEKNFIECPDLGHSTKK